MQRTLNCTNDVAVADTVDAVDDTACTPPSCSTSRSTLISAAVHIGPKADDPKLHSQYSRIQ
jgi:hypothetical protein